MDEQYRDRRVLREGRLHIVERAVRGSDGRAVVLKRPRGPHPHPRVLFSLHHEHDLLGQCAGPGVVRSLGLDRIDGQPVLVLEDVGPESLTERLVRGPLDLDEFLSRATQIAVALVTVHGAGVVHRDLNPNNLVLFEGETTLVDLGLATRFAGVPGGLSPSLTGTASYTSPEATGRTGLLVDERSDLYSLGATFYAMLTGGPPFGSGTLGAVLHAHIAVPPPPLRGRAPQLPPLLCELVHRLLSKRPSERYQSARGVLADLEEIARRRAAGESLEGLGLGQHDRPSGLRQPQGLHGREEVIDELAGILRDVARDRGRACLVVGLEGSGKTSLATRLQLLALQHGGRVGGSYGDGVLAPLSSLASALDRALEAIAASEPSVRSAVRAAIDSQVGDSADALSGLLPCLAQLELGQGAAPTLEPESARERLLQAMRALVAALAGSAAPLLLLVDDLGSVDDASRRFFVELAEAPPPGLMLLGTANPEAVKPDRPLGRLLAGMASPLHQVLLEPLGPRAMAALCAEALGLDEDEVASLAVHLCREVGGQPLAAMQRLRLMRSSGELHFGSEGRWRWRLPGPAITPPPGPVEGRAPPMLTGEALNVVATLAPLGPIFSLQAASAALELPPDALLSALEGPLELGVLQPLGDASLLPRGGGGLGLSEVDVRYRFRSERERRALEARMDPDRARQLFRAAAAAEGEDPEALRTRLRYLRQAGEALKEPGERKEAARVAREVALAALVPSAEEAAEAAEAGIAWLGGGFQAEPGLALELHCLAARALGAVGRGGQAAPLLARAEQAAPDPVDRADVVVLRVCHAVAQGEHAVALASLRRGMELLGEVLPADAATEPDPLPALLERLQRVSLDALRAGPAMSERRDLVAMALLDAAIPSAFFTDPPLFRQIILRMTVRTLERGIGPRSAYPLTYCALFLRGAQAFELAERFGAAGLELARERRDPGYLCRVLFTFAHHLQHWQGPLRRNLELFIESERAGLAAGDRQWAGYAMTGSLLNLFPAQVLLSRVAADVERTLPFLGRTGNHPMTAMAVPVRQLLRALQGRTSAGSLDDEEFSEADFLQSTEGVGAVQVLFRVHRLLAASWAGDWAVAAEQAKAIEPLLPFMEGMALNADHALHGGLAAAFTALGGDADALARAEELLLRLAAMAERQSANFGHRHQLLEGAIARARGDRARALDCFDESARRARGEGFLADAAQAHQLAGEMLAEEGKDVPALAYLTAARRDWLHWGARRPADEILRRHPQLSSVSNDASWSQASQAVSSNSSGSDGPSATVGLGRLDLSALLGAAEAIGSELDPAVLTGRLLATLVELSGAQRAVLIRPDEDSLRVRATLDAEGLHTRNQPLDSADDVPSTVVRAVARGEGTLVLESAVASPRFAADPVIARRGTTSVLCLAATRQKRLVSVLYLENDLVEGAFAPNRARMLGLLASQVAVALENAELFERLRRETAERLAAEKQLQRSQKLESVGRLASGVAHDFNNLLGVVLGWARLVLDDDATDSIDPREPMRQIARAAERGAELTRQLLAFSRASVANPVNLDLPRTLGELTRMLDRTVGDTIQLQQVPAPPDLPTARVDPSLLEQVIVNLVVNARDAMPEGGLIELSLRVEELHVELPSPACARPLRPGRYVVLAVSDRGEGIAPAVRQRLFEPFFTTKPVGRGSGLGLATCLGIAEQSGGTIMVRSREQRGTTFEVWLPAGAARAEESRAPERTIARGGRGERVLVVEDDPTLRQLLCVALQRYGFVVQGAESGEDALDQLVRSDPQVLLTDYTMPGMDGLELIAEARRLRPDLPVALLSGVAEVLDAAQAAGLDDVLLLQKPIRPDDLAAALAGVIDAG